MSEYDKFKKHIETDIIPCVSRFYSASNDHIKWIEGEIAKYKQDVGDSKRRRKRTAIATIQENDDEEIPSPQDNKKQEQETEEIPTAKRQRSIDSHPETDNSDATFTLPDRPKRNAAKQASQRITKQINEPLTSKMRRPDGSDEINIKQEKISIIPPTDNDNVITEMLPPKIVPPKAGKKTSVIIPVAKIKEEKLDLPVRSQRTKSRKKKSSISSTTSQDNDVVVIKAPHETIVYDLSDDESENERKLSLEDKSMHELPEKHIDNSKGEKSLYEDAVQDQSATKNCSVQLEPLNLLERTYKISSDGTVIIPPKESENEDRPLNVTVVLSKNDEEIEKINKKEAKEVKPTTSYKNKDLLFSSDAPVKKRVAAIEKLRDSPQTPKEPAPRVTRTKTRAQKAALEAIESKENQADYNSDSESVKKGSNNLNSKHTTPLQFGRLMPLTQKPSNLVTNVDSFIAKPEKRAPRSVSREDSRRKADEDVLKKKEALLTARSEEQRKRREEKQQKAQQVRLQKEKERQLQIEKAERDREEKQKQLNAEKELYKKEQLRKKAILDKKAIELEERRKADEEEAERQHLKRVQEEVALAKAKARAQKIEASKSKQPQKIKKLGTTPLANGTPISKIATLNKAKAAAAAQAETVFDMNTDDDSDQEINVKRVVPDWSSKTHLRQTCLCIKHLPDNLYCTLFSSKPTSINLAEIFENIDPSRLRRQSSAVWRTPPRYSQMPKF